MAGNISAARLLAELQKNPELITAIRDAETETELSAFVLAGEQQRIIERKTEDDTSEDTRADMFAALVTAAGYVVDNVKVSGTSGNQRLSIPFGEGTMTFEYKTK